MNLHLDDLPVELSCTINGLSDGAGEIPNRFCTVKIHENLAGVYQVVDIPDFLPQIVRCRWHVARALTDSWRGVRVDDVIYLNRALQNARDRLRYVGSFSTCLFPYVPSFSNEDLAALVRYAQGERPGIAGDRRIYESVPGKPAAELPYWFTAMKFKFPS